MDRRYDALKNLLIGLGVFGAYFAAGKIGLGLAVVNPSTSAVWPPTGIAVAAFLLLGFEIWPAIYLGAFLVNLTTTQNALPSIIIAVGNTLEGWVAAYLVNRFAQGRRTFEQSGNVFKFAGLAAGLSTLISATIGTATLVFSKLAPRSDCGMIWQTWWQGDAMGCLVVAPLLILLANPGSLQPREDHPRKVLEKTLLFTTTLWLALTGFCALYPSPMLANFLRAGCIPLVIWAAFRFGPRETVMSSFILCCITVWGTIH
jgi:integral membrane sensor domain MASE1